MNKDKYWTGKDVAEQLRAKIPTFKRLHPGHKLLYAFDNSYTHDCWPDDALDASILNLNPPPAVARPIPPPRKKKKATAPVDGPAPAPIPPPRKKKKTAAPGPAPAPVDGPAPAPIPPPGKKKKTASSWPCSCACQLMALPPPLRLLLTLPPPLHLHLPLPLHPLLRGKPNKTTCALAGTGFVRNVQLISCQVHSR